MRPSVPFRCLCTRSENKSRPTHVFPSCLIAETIRQRPKQSRILTRPTAVPEHNCCSRTFLIKGGAKRMHVFSNNCNFVYFQYKKIMSTPKQHVMNAVLITYIDYSITENYIGKMASFLPYIRPEPLHKVLHHIY